MTRIITQPAAAAVNGRLFIAINSSTSPAYGAGIGSMIRLLYSPDGGTTWNAPVTVAAATAAAPQHALPAITVDPTGSRLRIVDYVQDAGGRIGVESQSGSVSAEGASFGKSSQIASPFDLPPTNVTISRTVTGSYDVVAPCYALGEYLSATPGSNGPIAAWGADRQLWKEPPGAIVSGVHAQQDAFVGALP